jgi:hypothetical protein
MSHAAIPAPASTPNAKTATPVITRTGVRIAQRLGAGSVVARANTKTRGGCNQLPPIFRSSVINFA